MAWVEWWIVEKTGWLPWNKFYGIFADKLKGPVLEKGLDQLKTVLKNSTLELVSSVFPRSSCTLLIIALRLYNRVA
jgi:hypothetical protein